MIERGLEDGHSIFDSALGSFGMTSSSLVSIIDGDQERRHVAIEDSVGTGTIGLILKVPSDMGQAMSLVASGCVDEACG
jgi:hypothetical protein